MASTQASSTESALRSSSFHAQRPALDLLARIPEMTLATHEPLPLRPSNFIVGIEEMPVEFEVRG